MGGREIPKDVSRALVPFMSMLAVPACEHARPPPSPGGPEGAPSAAPWSVLRVDAPAAGTAAVGTAPASFQPPIATAVPAPPLPGDEGDASAPADEPLDAVAWLRDHGVSKVEDRWQGDLLGCKPNRVGAPARDGLLCEGGPMEGSLPGGESLFSLTILFPDHGRLKVALRVPKAAGPLDQERLPAPDDPDHGYYILLAWELSADGTRFTLHDRPESSCAERLRSYRAQNRGDSGLAGILTPHIRVIEAACRARGVYTWRGDRFSR